MTNAININPANSTLSECVDLPQLRAQIRSNQFTGNTSGLMPGLVQGNIVVLPAKVAEEFLVFCHLNTIPCPVIGFSQAGDPSLPMLGSNLDIRVDVPEYCVFREGELCETVADINDYWEDDSVAIVIGCSYSFEDALMSAGYRIRNIDMGLNVSMYDTNIPTQATEHFSGNTVVSMRPFKPEDIAAVTDITSQFSKTHGAPIHLGDPAAIGILNIQQPNYGDAVPIADNEVPVFWGCGVTSQRILRDAKLPLVITHAPGKMLITDVRYEQL
jgi:uncharacterized protein YcsI (UPF0317 family)